MKQPGSPEPLLIISSSPHLHCGSTVSAAMRDVLLALVPTLAAAVYYFGTDALSVIAASCAAAVLAEALCQKAMRRPVTITDGSALLTGLLLAFCLPPQLAPGLAAFGAACAIIIGKQVFGGLGANIFNPAHIGRAILLASFPAQMTTWSLPLTADAPAAVTAATTSATTSATPAAADAVTTATPLALLRQAEHLWQAGNLPPDGLLPDLTALFMGNTAGSLGETCVPALVLGGLYLIWRQVIDWRIPLFYIATTGLICTGCLTITAPPLRCTISAPAGLLSARFLWRRTGLPAPLPKRGASFSPLGWDLSPPLSACAEVILKAFAIPF